MINLNLRIGKIIKPFITHGQFIAIHQWCLRKINHTIYIHTKKVPPLFSPNDVLQPYTYIYTEKKVIKFRIVSV